MKRRTDPTDPLAWLARAKSNLKIAELGSSEPGVFWNRPACKVRRKSRPPMVSPHTPSRLATPTGAKR